MKNSKLKKRGKTLFGLQREFEAPTWDQIYRMTLNLAERIRKDHYHPDIIVGICRGGWVPARIISDVLDQPELANIRVKFYSSIGETRSKPIITQPLSISVANKDVLIVDDVADSGRSLKLVSDHIKEQGANRVKTTTIYCKPWSEIVPNYFEKKTTCWVIFPWEPKEVIKNLIEQYLREGGPIDEARNKLRRSGLDPELTERFIGKILAERSVKT